MSRDKEHRNELLESDQIADDLAAYTAREGSRLLEDLPDLPYRLTRKTDKRLHRLLRQNLRRQNPRYGYLRKGLIAAAVLLALFITVQASAIKSAITNYFIRQREESLDFSARHRPDQDSWKMDAALPTYFPPGYVFAKPDGQREEHANVLTFLYTCPGKKEIRLSVYAGETSIRMNSEDSDKQERVSFNGETGYYSIVKGYMQLVWGKSPAYILEGPGSEEEHLLLMAESIVIQSNVTEIEGGIS